MPEGKGASIGISTAFTIAMSLIPGMQPVAIAFMWTMWAVQTVLTLSASTSEDSGAAASENGQLTNTSSTQKEIPLIYGCPRVGINIAYIGVSGDNNKYLHIVGIVGEGVIHGIRQVEGVDRLFLDDELHAEFGSLVYYEFFQGTPDQNVCATLNAAIPEWTDPLRHTAYIYLRLEWDQNKFQSLPNVTLEVEGLELYDPRTETTGYTNNPALAARDFVTRSSRRGGMEIGADRLDGSILNATAAYCETKGWTVGLPIMQNLAASDILIQILATFRGAMCYSGCIYKLKYLDLDYESSVMDLTENDVVRVSSGESSLHVVQPSIFDTPNAVRCKFLNEEKKYQEDDYVKSDPDAIDDDGDYREETISLLGVNSYANVQKLANYWLERLRINQEATLRGGSRCLALEVLDLVTLTHTLPAWDQQILRVEAIQLDPDGNIGLSLKEENADFYNDAYDGISHAWHSVTLPKPSDVVQGVRNVSHSEEVYFYRSRSFTRWKIDFDAPDPADYPWWDHAEIYSKIGAGDWKFMTKATSDYQLDPVEEGVSYSVKIRSVSIHGVKEAFEDAYTVSTTIIGKEDVPSDVTNFSVSAAGNVVTFSADDVADPDVVGYEIRMGASWEGGSFIGFNLSPRFRASYVSPGNKTFWIAARDNAGNYSENPASASVVVPYPSNYDYKEDWSWDYDGIGTHSNTEHAIHETADALKCSHTGNVLTGIWQSPTYDVGSVKRIKIYGDFLSDFVAGSKTWSGIFPNTWAADAGKTWNQILNVDYKGNLTSKLHYGEAAWNENEVEGFESLAPEVDARYLRVDVEIEDPELDANLYVYALNMTALSYV